MDSKTYEFCKNSLYREITNNNMPNEIKEEIKLIKNKGFKIKHLENPQLDSCKNVMDGSYVIELYYDFGKEIKKFLLVTILKNIWTSWKTEWWIRLDEVNFKLIKGNDFEVLMKTIDAMLEQGKDILGVERYVLWKYDAESQVKYFCSNCKEPLFKNQSKCKCGQSADWNKEVHYFGIVKWK